MAMHHGSAGHPLDRDINLYMEDSETTGLDNHNENTHGSDTTIALGGPEAEGHPNDLIYSNQARCYTFHPCKFTLKRKLYYLN